jgi:hypothetical protein
MVTAFAVPSSATISQGYRGRITAKSTGLPVPNASTLTCTDSGCLNSESAKANGRYQAATPPGTYKPVFGVCCTDGHNPGFLVPATYGPGGKSLPGFDQHGAEVTVVTAHVVEGVSFRLTSGGGISVHVHDHHGNPISGVYVSPLWHADGHQSGLADQTDSNGDRELDGVMAGGNRIDVFDLTNTWAEKVVKNVVVTVGAVTHIDITLKPATSPARAHPSVVLAP